ncbi:MAG: hypothetical protein ACI87O_002980, partial [Planctomycetota bacterium]
MQELEFEIMSYETRVLPERYAGHADEDFSDILYDWMERAPWVGISLGLHFVAYMIVASIPWSTWEKEIEKPFQSDFAQVIPPEEEPPIPPDEIIICEEIIEPVIQEELTDETTETDDPLNDLIAMGDPEFQSDAAFESFALNSA